MKEFEEEAKLLYPEAVIIAFMIRIKDHFVETSSTLESCREIIEALRDLADSMERSNKLKLKENEKTKDLEFYTSIPENQDYWTLYDSDTESFLTIVCEGESKDQGLPVIFLTEEKAIEFLELSNAPKTLRPVFIPNNPTIN
jgi:hypothetical protein